MTNTAAKLLANLVAPFPGGADFGKRTDIAIALTIEDASFPSIVADALNGFLENPGETRLYQLQEAVIRAGQWGIGSACFVTLTAWLVAASKLDRSTAARSLSALPHSERKRLSSHALHLVEVADAVIEDAREQIMEVDDDRLFVDAVGNMLANTRQLNE